MEEKTEFTNTDGKRPHTWLHTQPWHAGVSVAVMSCVDGGYDAPSLLWLLGYIDRCDDPSTPMEALHPHPFGPRSGVMLLDESEYKATFMAIALEINTLIAEPWWLGGARPIEYPEEHATTGSVTEEVADKCREWDPDTGGDEALFPIE